MHLEDSAGEYSHTTRIVATIATVCAAAAIAPVAVQGYTSAMVADAIRAIATGVCFLVLYRAGLALLLGRHGGLLDELELRTVGHTLGRSIATLAVWLGVWVFPLAALGPGLVELAGTVWLDSILVVGPLWAIDRGVWALRR
ncbi:MAG: hypothetical protein U5K37_10370 [Natrialbaceae archaeon]|nr:hypothetical protein [Natrialbaceae archaeon]